MVLNSLGVNAYVFCGAWVEWAYAINPANNHPDRATVIRFTEELFTDGEPGCGGCGGVSACGMMDETETGAITTPSGTAVTTVLIVRDICCMSCGGDVITAIRTVDGVFQVSVDLAEDSVTVVHCSYTNVYDMVDAVNDNTRFTVESEDTIKLVVTVEPETAVESAATITTLLFVGMCCIRCASDVIAAVKVLDGVVQIITDLTEESVTIIHHPRLSADAIRNALVATGRDVS
jgi:copper chaperone CopZ